MRAPLSDIAHTENEESRVRPRTALGRVHRRLGTRYVEELAFAHPCESSRSHRLGRSPSALSPGMDGRPFRAVVRVHAWPPGQAMLAVGWYWTTSSLLELLERSL